MESTEQAVDRIAAGEQTVWHTILRTCRDELIHATLTYGDEQTKRTLARKLRRASEDEIEHVVRKLGDCLMEGGDYWESIPVAVERAMP